jgi:hypothetical protein
MRHRSPVFPLSPKARNWAGFPREALISLRQSGEQLNRRSADRFGRTQAEAPTER